MRILGKRKGLLIHPSAPQKRSKRPYIRLRPRRPGNYPTPASPIAQNLLGCHSGENGNPVTLPVILERSEESALPLAHRMSFP